MKRKNLAKNYKNVLLTGFLFLMSYSHAQQEIIYQQNFDGNNGTFPNTIVSQYTPINGWIASSTAPQYAEIYRHLWNFSDVTAGGNPETMPISGKSLGFGFYEGNDPFVPNQHFHYYAGEPADIPFYTTRWAHVGISTEGYENITVEFKWRCTGEIFQGIVYDYGTVNTSIDGGATWLMDQTGGYSGTTSEHGTFAGGLYYGNPNVQTTVITLPESRSNQPNFRLAFRMVVDEGYGTGGGFIVDDIIVRGTPIVNMANDELNKSHLVVYKEGKNFIVKSSQEKIKEVKVYDLNGKLILSGKVQQEEYRISEKQLSKGIYIVKAILENGIEVSQKIIK